MIWGNRVRVTGASETALAWLSAAAILLVLTQDVSAATIRCVYTEPFINTVFTPRSKTVAVTRLGGPATKFRVDVRGDAASIRLTNARHAFRQTMSKDGKGSDGMSDNVFPYSATLSMKGTPSTLHGGCR